ncbi:MAG TPA: LysR family transcriptional regulator [Xanthobacteraceae bacterium]|jgi:DNA-binding transcriptional LysR family regulator|nr:LysR family transcriptional regulator [Xanthobacteraceae bacterium]
MLPVTLRRLEVFLAVVDSKGFSAAADALGISQPSVSVHIKAIERSVGAELFRRRNGSPPVLTEAGQRFCEYARETVRGAGQLAADLVRHARERRPQLRCAAQRSVSHSILPGALACFTKKFPEVELITHTGTFAEVCELFANRAVDMALVISPGEIAGMRSEVIGRCRLSFVASPKHPLARMSRISPQELAKHRFVSANRTSYLGRTIADLLMRSGVSQLDVTAQMHEFGLVRELVAAGIGFSCCLRRNIAGDLAAGTLVELDVDVPALEVDLRLLRSKACAEEIDTLVDVIRSTEFSGHSGKGRSAA